MKNIKPTVLSGWDAVYTRDNSIIKRTLDEYVVGVRRTTWRNTLREQGREESYKASHPFKLSYLSICLRNRSPFNKYKTKISAQLNNKIEYLMQF